MPVNSNFMLLCDRRNSVVKTFRREGAVSSATYGPYGWRRLHTIASAVGFNGQRVEPLTEWYDLGHGHRVYNPMLQRFHTPDRLSPFGKGGLNAYAYCLGDPVNYEDPTGQFVREIIGGLVNGVRKVARDVSDYVQNFVRPVQYGSLEEAIEGLDEVIAVSTFSTSVLFGAAIANPGLYTAVMLVAGPPTGVALGSNVAQVVNRARAALGYGLPIIYEVAGAGLSRLSRGLNVLEQARGNYWGFPRAGSLSDAQISSIQIRG